MKTSFYRWIFLVIFVLIIQISANFSDYKLAFEDNHFLVDGVLQVINCDLDNDHNEEMIVAGRNNDERETFIYWLTFDPQFKPVIKWQSPNLFEERSTVLWVAVGKFTSTKNQILAFSNTQYYLYQFENNNVNLVKQGVHNIDKILNVTAGDVDGDGQSEIIIAKVGKITPKFYDGIVQILRFKEDKLELISESGLMGNIRGLATGDLDQDGQSEILVEEGNKFAPGNLHILKYKEKNVAEIYSYKKISNGPLYSMQVKLFSDGPKLVTGSANGAIDFFSWDNNGLTPVGKRISLDCDDLMTMAVVDFNNDKNPKLILVKYPQDLLILSK